MLAKLFWTIIVGFDVTDQLLIINFYVSDSGERNKSMMRQFNMDFKKLYLSFRREIYKFRIELELPMKLVRLIKFC
jgi:hypothetical protein